MFLLSLLFYTQPICADSFDKNNLHPHNIKGIRVEHKDTIRFFYNNKLYTVYATHCGEIIIHPSESDYIILSPGEPVELKDKSGNILILYSLPCN